MTSTVNFDGAQTAACAQGELFDRTITWKDGAGNPIDLTNYTAKMHVRLNYQAAKPLLAFDTADGTIVLGGVAGTIRLLKNVGEIVKVDGDARSLVPAKMDCVYDLILTPPSPNNLKPVKLIAGVFSFTALATK